MRCAAICCGLATLAIVVAGAAQAQTKRDPGEIHGLKLGLAAGTMILQDWGELACGSKGGPPRQKLDAWSDFVECRPEASGLHEVAARFEDEAEYIGKAIDDPLYAAQRTGTRIAGHPVILSALFDDNGILRGIRFVTDPRATSLERRMAHMLRLAIMNHYDPDGWKCTDASPAEGETPVGGVFVKQRCDKLMPERAMTMEAQFLRKPGQNAIDPATREYTQGQFESWTRFELYDPAYKMPDRH